MLLCSDTAGAFNVQLHWQFASVGWQRIIVCGKCTRAGVPADVISCVPDGHGTSCDSLYGSQSSGVPFPGRPPASSAFAAGRASMPPPRVSPGSTPCCSLLLQFLPTAFRLLICNRAALPAVAILLL